MMNQAGGYNLGSAFLDTSKIVGSGSGRADDTGYPVKLELYSASH